MIFPLRLIKYICVCDEIEKSTYVRWNWRWNSSWFFHYPQPLSTTIRYSAITLTDRTWVTWVTYLTHALFRKILRIKSNSHPIDWTPRSMNRTCFTYVRKWRCCTWVTSTNRKEEKKNHIYLNIPQNLSNKKI